MPARHLGEEVRRGGRHDDKVGVAGEADMTDVGLRLAVEEIGVRPLARKRGGGERRDETLRAGGENGAHGRAALAQAADEVERFVGRDAAADDEEDALGGEGRGHLISPGS